MGSVSHAQTMPGVKAAQPPITTQQQQYQQQQVAMAAAAAYQLRVQRRVPVLVNGILQPRKALHELKVTAPDEPKPKQYTIDPTKGNIGAGFTLTRTGVSNVVNQRSMTHSNNSRVAAATSSSHGAPQRPPVRNHSPKMMVAVPARIEKDVFNMEECTDEEAASQLLNLTRSLPPNQTLETDTKSSCSSTYSSGNSKSGRRLKKSASI
eukprot:gb/GECG01005783.1/.p1 GENE.gb/GECG01005783.1/~~gb/GECG01005783.1/.p1  ORF type:complete len:208 (+),score=22.95 gb/GECG01005783.1/:1-624(+)